MINVLHVGHSRKWRGGENQVRLLIEGLQQENHDIKNHIAYPSAAIAHERLEQFTSNNLILPSTRPFDPRSIAAIVDFVKKNNINIIDAHSGNAHTLSFYAKQFLPKLKLVVHRRVDNPIKKNFLTRAKYLSSRIDRWVAISEKINTLLVDYGVNAENIRIIKSSVKPHESSLADKRQEKQLLCQKLGLNAQLPLIGFAGALDSQKNPLLFVDVIHKLASSGIQFNAVMAGSGQLQEQVEEKINQLKLTEHIVMLGFINTMRQYFAALDVFVLPSRNEGLGTVLMEAVNAKCAIVASNVGGIGEIIIDQQTGHLVDANSTDSFYEAIKMSLDNPLQTDSLKIQAFKHVSSNFSFKAMINDSASLYQQLIRSSL